MDPVLQPAGCSFEGIEVSEHNPDPLPASRDTCYFPGSLYSPYDRLDSPCGPGGLASWTIRADNRYDDYDVVGWGALEINYYRTHPEGSPSAEGGCSTTLGQEMHGPCGLYTVNTIILGIQKDTLTAQRGTGEQSACAPEPWPDP